MGFNYIMFQIPLGADECYGRPYALNINSREDEDRRAINAYDYAHGIE